MEVVSLMTQNADCNRINIMKGDMYVQMWVYKWTGTHMYNL